MEPQAYAFGRFRMDVASRQLLRDGTHVPLAAKAFDTLLVLVRRRDRAVTKDELMKAVWPDTFVSDDSLTQSISSLRRTLGDAEVIATIPRRGYRFIAPVVEDPPPDWEALREMAAAGIRDQGLGIRDPGSAVPSVAESLPPISGPGSRIPPPGSRRHSWLAIALVLAAVATALLIGRVFGQ